MCNISPFYPTVSNKRDISFSITDAGLLKGHGPFIYACEHALRRTCNAAWAYYKVLLPFLAFFKGLFKWISYKWTGAKEIAKFSFQDFRHVIEVKQEWSPILYYIALNWIILCTCAMCFLLLKSFLEFMHWQKCQQFLSFRGLLALPTFIHAQIGSIHDINL